MQRTEKTCSPIAAVTAYSAITITQLSVPGSGVSIVLRITPPKTAYAKCRRYTKIESIPTGKPENPVLFVAFVLGLTQYCVAIPYTKLKKNHRKVKRSR
jgi:hypothetical protein